MNLLCINHQPFTDFKSINFHSNKMSKYCYYIQFYRGENWDTERVGLLSEIVQPVNGWNWNSSSMAQESGILTSLLSLGFFVCCLFALF